MFAQIQVEVAAFNCCPCQPTSLSMLFRLHVKCFEVFCWHETCSTESRTDTSTYPAESCAAVNVARTSV